MYSPLFSSSHPMEGRKTETFGWFLIWFYSKAPFISIVYVSCLSSSSFAPWAHTSFVWRMELAFTENYVPDERFQPIWLHVSLEFLAVFFFPLLFLFFLSLFVRSIVFPPFICPIMRLRYHNHFDSNHISVRLRLYHAMSASCLLFRKG